MISTSKVNLYIQCFYLLIYELFILNEFYYKYLFTILLLILMISLL